MTIGTMYETNKLFLNPTPSLEMQPNKINVLLKLALLQYLGLSPEHGVVHGPLNALSQDLQAVEMRMFLAGEVGSPFLIISPQFHCPVRSKA